MKNILLVEADQELRIELQRILSWHQYAVLSTGLGQKAVELISAKSIDLCLMDTDLLDGSGWDLCRDIRCVFKIPVIILSSENREKDIIRGLQGGADDYVTKPFSSDILMCRIECLLRRVKWDKIDESGKVRCMYTGDLLIDMDHHMIFRNGTEVGLSHTEFLLCSSLAYAGEMILMRQVLLTKIWEERDRMVEDSTLTVHICRLRKKLGRYQGEPYIRTVRGMGYRWNVKVK